VGLEYLMSAAESIQTSGEPVDLTAAYYTGDVDNDEAITSSDLYAVMQYLAWKGSGKEAVTLTTDGEAAEAAALDAADVNGDGKIDTTDMYMILKYCAEKGHLLCTDSGRHQPPHCATQHQGRTAPAV